MELVNRNGIENEGNDVEMNRSGDYLQAMCWFQHKNLHRYPDLQSHYAQKEGK